MLAVIVRFATLLFGVLLLAAPAQAQNGKRVALVIANAAYRNVPALANPPADAALVERALRQTGFAVEIVRDLDKASFDAALQRFSARADGADVAMIYYAGHGIEVGGQNFLVPVGARLARDRDTEVEAVALRTVLRFSEGARMRIVVLDACRDNPFANQMQRAGGTRAVTRGLGRVEPDQDTLVVYAAREGSVAADGTGGNSPFARALAKRLVEPGVEVGLTFRRVRDDVVRDTGRQQEPFTYGSLSGQEFYFVAPNVVAVPAPPPATPAFAASKPAANSAGIADGAARWGLTVRDLNLVNDSALIATAGGLARLPAIRTAAAGGDQIAALLLGMMLEKGDGVARDVTAGLALYRPAAEAGNARAQVKVGWSYENGWGVTQDYAQALQWYRRASEAGNAIAMNQIGWFYQKGYDVAQDYGQAMQWYRRAADSGSGAGLYNVGYFYENALGVSKDYSQALQWYRRAAEAGHLGGMNQVGWFYQNGWDVARDYGQAMQWYRRSADAGNGVSMSNVGWLYQNALGVQQDNAQALQWYQRGAETGDAMSMNQIGWFYQQGMQVGQDFAQAMQWYRRAANAGSGTGMSNVGWLYENGKGVPVDIEQAVQWYRKSAAAGSSEGKTALQRLGRQ